MSIRNWSVPALSALSLELFTAALLHTTVGQDRQEKDRLETEDPTNKGEPARPTADGKPLPDKTEVMQKAKTYLESRYDLSGKTDPEVKMSGGRKPLPVGPTARLPEGVTWEQLGHMTAGEIRDKDLFPYPPLWHPLQEVGGMVFPQVQTKVVTGLERVDVEFDLPDAYLPEFPPALFLTTRPDLGDVSKGQLVTLQNFEELFQDVLTPFQRRACDCCCRRRRPSGTT